MDTSYAETHELELRVNLSDEDATDDDLLQHYLNTAAQMTDELTRGEWRDGYEAFSASEEETRLFDDYNKGYVAIDDLLSATTITRGGTDITTTYYQLHPYNTLPKTELRFRSDAPYYTSDAGYWYGYPLRGVGYGQIAITGVWGYCEEETRPPLVKELTLQIAEMLYMEMSLSSQELMAALRNPTTEAQKRIAGLAEMLQRREGVVVG